MSFLTYASVAPKAQTVVSLSTAWYKPLMFPVSAFALSSAQDMFIPTVLYDLDLLPAQVWCLSVCMWKTESHVQTDLFKSIHSKPVPTSQETSRLHYKAQPVNTVWRNRRCSL
jgi:hypothetical protein